MTLQRLVGTAEIEAEHGLSRVQVWRLLDQGDFPQPVAKLKRVRVWDAEDVSRWVKRARAEGRLLENGALVPPYLRNAS